MSVQTSRHYVIDAIQMIGSLVAECSHLQEIVNSYWTNDEITSDDAMFCVERIRECNDIRRWIMDKIKNDFNGNMHYWCSLKHAIEIWQYATEIMYANMDDTYLVHVQHKASDMMYSILSKFINQEITTCWRCMNDVLLSDENIWK